MLCRGPGGWSLDNAAGIQLTPEAGGSTYGPSLGAWTVTNDAATQTTVMSLTNTEIPSLTIEKTDASGALLRGGTFAAQSCTRWENDLNWQCQDLNDYAWLNGDTYPDGLRKTDTTGDGFTQEIQTMGLWDNPVQQCLVVQETAAPAGYTARTAPAAVCKGPGGWTAANAASVNLVVNGVTMAGELGDWTVTNDRSTMSTVLRLVNEKIATPSPVTPPRPGLPTPAPEAGAADSG